MFVNVPFSIGWTAHQNAISDIRIILESFEHLQEQIDEKGYANDPGDAHRYLSAMLSTTLHLMNRVLNVTESLEVELSDPDSNQPNFQTIYRPHNEVEAESIKKGQKE